MLNRAHPLDRRPRSRAGGCARTISLPHTSRRAQASHGDRSRPIARCPSGCSRTTNCDHLGMPGSRSSNVRLPVRAMGFPAQTITQPTGIAGIAGRTSLSQAKSMKETSARSCVPHSSNRRDLVITMAMQQRAHDAAMNQQRSSGQATASRKSSRGRVSRLGGKRKVDRGPRVTVNGEVIGSPA